VLNHWVSTNFQSFLASLTRVTSFQIKLVKKLLLQWKIFHFYDCGFNITEFDWILRFWKFVKIWKCFLKHQVHTSSTLIFHQTVLLIKLIFSWGFSHQKGGRERMCRYVCVYLNVKEIGSKCVGDAHLASLSMITSENVFLKTFFSSSAK